MYNVASMRVFNFKRDILYIPTYTHTHTHTHTHRKTKKPKTNK